MLKVEKRNGRIVDYGGKRIALAIEKAMDKTDKRLGKTCAKEAADKVTQDFEAKNLNQVSIEEIQDAVELHLMQVKPNVAKKYILYREERTRLREQGWAMNGLQRDVYEKKYRYKGETFEGFLNRVSGGNEAIEKVIRDKKFTPAGRILAGYGLHKESKKVTLSNCYVMPKVEDDIEAIFDTAKWTTRIYSHGGGVGLTLSKLRPKGVKVNDAASFATGAVNFMDLYSLTIGPIGMRGRRGALMLNLDCFHPDILEFIDVKNDLEKVTSANISVNVYDDSMEVVKKDRDYTLRFDMEATEERIRKKVSAREMLTILARDSWNMAEPGILYQDRISSWHLLSEDDIFEYARVNLCAEEPLLAFGSCNLSSINLGGFVVKSSAKYACFQFEVFGELVRDGVVYLNDVLDKNVDLHPLEEQREPSKDLRQIGLGAMGVADMFIKTGMPYGSSESLNLIDQIDRVLVNEALHQSALLAKDQGPFPRYRKEKVLRSLFLKANADEDVLDLIKEYGLRNSQVLTIAPTGTIPTLLGCSNGMEPIFQISCTRKSESLHSKDTCYTVYTQITKDLMETQGLTSEEGLPDYVVTTSNLNYEEGTSAQSTQQQFIDASTSSTVNVPEEFTVEEVEDSYMYAWEMGLKGVTIYRDGCTRSGILITENSKKSWIQELQDDPNREITKQLMEDPDTCPMCDGIMAHSGGCAECQNCGYSLCVI